MNAKVVMSINVLKSLLRVQWALDRLDGEDDDEVYGNTPSTKPHIHKSWLNIIAFYYAPELRMWTVRNGALVRGGMHMWGGV